jgi:Sulfotransferase family
MLMGSASRDDGRRRGHARAPSGADVRLPDFLIVGAEKCGTTSLYQYLKQHPDVYLPAKKELHYFAYDDIGKIARDPGGENVLTHACATREEYESYYRGTGAYAAVGEVSPSYFYFSHISERLQSELDDPKIIIMLRDPVKKAHSQYMHLVRDNREHLSFFDALMAEDQRIEAGWGPLWRYTESSLYSSRVAKYLQVFGKDRVKIGFFEDLLRSPEAVINDLLEFIGVAPGGAIDTSRAYNRSGRPRSRLLADFLAKPNPVTAAARRWVPEHLRDRIKHAMLDLNTGRKDAIDDRSRAYLRQRFAGDVRELEQILGTRLNWWD